MKESEGGKYAFLVQKRANKGDIRRAVEAFFQVDVVSVLTMTQKGRTKRVGARRTEVKDADFKKAVVTLKKGQTLGGTTEEAKTEEPKKKEKKEKKVEK
jgi:large subunit ribosomal protein L23